MNQPRDVFSGLIFYTSICNKNGFWYNYNLVKQKKTINKMVTAATTNEVTADTVLLFFIAETPFQTAIIKSSTYAAGTVIFFGSTPSIPIIIIAAVATQRIILTTADLFISITSYNKK